MSSLIWLALGLGVVLILVIVARLWGASQEAQKSASRSAGIKDKQIEAALDRPANRADTVQRLRNKGL